MVRWQLLVIPFESGREYRHSDEQSTTEWTTQPSSRDFAKIRSKITELKHRAALLRVQIRDSPQPPTPTTQAELDSIQSLIEVEKSAISPIRMLPSEILYEIFGHFVYGYRQMPEKLLLVCRDWHSHAILPRLWVEIPPLVSSSGLPLSCTGTYIQTRVARSYPLPLDLDFTWLADSSNRTTALKQISEIPGLLPRCRSVVIDCSAAWALVQGFQPLLQKITMGARWDRLDWRLNSTVTPYHTPALRHLNIIYAPPRNWNRAVMAQLEVLSVVVGWHACDLEEAYEFIQLTPNIRTLQLRIHIGFSFGIWVAHALPIPIICQHLTRLILIYREEPLGQPCHPFKHIELPNLTHLEVDISRPRLLVGMFTAVQNKLHTFTIRSWTELNPENLSMDASVLIAYLRSVPQLTRLEMCTTPYTAYDVVLTLEKDFTFLPRLQEYLFEYPPVIDEDSDSEDGQGGMRELASSMHGIPREVEEIQSKLRARLQTINASQ